METTLDLSRWNEMPRSVAYRRWSIVSTGLRLVVRTRLFRYLIGLAWAAGLGIAVLGFLFSQSVASGGWLEFLAHRFGPRMDAIGTALAGFVTLYPDICVSGIFTLIFWIHAGIALFLSLVALTAVIPKLITHDRASQALIIYLARPLTTVDYLLGKLGIIVGVIVLMWTGPLLFGWLVSMLFATDMDFVVYSLVPLGRALLFNAIALVALAAIALGVSASARTSRATIMIWMVLWLVCGVLSAPPPAPVWIKRASFSHDLNQVREQVLQVESAFTTAATKLPLLNQRFSDNLNRAGDKTRATDFKGALAGLAILAAASSVVFARKLRPES